MSVWENFDISVGFETKTGEKHSHPYYKINEPKKWIQISLNLL